MTQSMKSAILALAASASVAGAVPASANPFSDLAAGVLSQSSEAQSWQHGRDRDWRGGDDDQGYGDRGYYGQRAAYNEPVYANEQSWRGDDGRYYCRRKNGTTGLLVGGVVGGLIGHEVAGRRGDRTLGVILGAAGGALLGRAIDRGGSRCQ